MYFDCEYYLRILRFVWGQKQWPGRRRMLFRLLVVMPPLTLFNTLCFLLDYVVFPRLWRQRVEAPVFVVGHARSGTTLMHRLMSADGERFSYFLYWETFFPSLLQKKVIRALGWLDDRLLRGYCHAKLKAWDDKTFGPLRHMHDMSLWNSEEDLFALRGAFVTQQWSTEMPVLDVIDLFHVDQMPRKRRRWMHHYRECVKRQLLLNGGNRIHLSKNPLMSGWVGALIETFPDARIVVMMRDPKQCIPSLLKLMEKAWQSKGWSQEDYRNSLERMQEICFETFRNPLEQLSRHPDVARSVVDYRALIRDPRATVHQVYRDLGLEVSPAFDAYLQAQAEREKTHQSRFEYSLGDYALSDERIESELAELYERYQWPRSSAAAANTAS